MPTDESSRRHARAVVRLHDGRLDLTPGLVTPRVTRLRGDAADVRLLATTATLLGGDELRLAIEVGAGQTLRLTDVAATVAYDGRGATARIDVRIDVAENGTLVWAAEPLVLAEGARVERSLRASVAEHGRLLVRDQLVLGRAGERGGDLTCRTRVTWAGRPAHAEDLRLSPGDHHVAMTGTSRILDSAVAVGCRPPTPAHGTELVWALPGAIVRDLAPEAHLSAVGPAWAGWVDWLERVDRVDQVPAEQARGPEPTPA